MPYLNDQLEAHTLGETNREIEFDDLSSLQDITLDLLQQSRRRVFIISRHLDPQLYDQQDVIDALSRLARSGRNAEINILVHDSMPAVRDGHKLINLHQRLNSYIHIRRIHSDYKDYNEALCLVDDVAFIHRSFADRFTGSANYKDPLQTKQYGILFNDIWQISEPDPQVRRLHI